MLRTFVASLAALAALAPHSAHAVVCALDPVPGATLLLPYFYFGLAEAPASRSLLWAPALLLSYVVYALATATFHPLALLRLALYVALPTGLVRFGAPRKGPAM